jgi:hypothetical protein
VEEGEWRRGTRRGAGSDDTERGHQRTSTWRSKRWRARSGDSGSSKAGEEWAKLVEAGAAESGGVWLGSTLTALPWHRPFIPPPPTQP